MLVYLTLAAGMLLAWLPLFGRSLPFSDDFDFMSVISEGGIPGYLRWLGFFRPLGQYLPVWLFLENRGFHPILVLSTHLISGILLFHVCRSLYGGIRLPVAVALVFLMFPFGYEAMVWIANYSYVLAPMFLLANLLLLLEHTKRNWPASVTFCLSAGLALLTSLSHEILFFATVFSGLFACIDARTGRFRSLKSIRGGWWLPFAPIVGCGLWAVAYYSVVGQSRPKRITGLHLQTIVSVSFRQYSLTDIFHPWFSAVTRPLAFSAWSVATWIACACLISLLLAGLIMLSGIPAPQDGRRGTGFHALVATLALWFGASLIFAFGGGYSLDSRKKYPLLPLLLLIACWFCRALRNKLPVSPGAFWAVGSVVCCSAAMSSWLIVGIWKYESARYNALADFIVKHKLRGHVLVRWKPDLNVAWPQMARTVGYRFDDPAALNLAVEYRGGSDVNVTSSAQATAIRYDPAPCRWFFAK
jgi:hypothetical protein